MQNLSSKEEAMTDIYEKLRERLDSHLNSVC